MICNHAQIVPVWELEYTAWKFAMGPRDTTRC